jgi:hypothetical protein
VNLYTYEMSAFICNLAWNVFKYQIHAFFNSKIISSDVQKRREHVRTNLLLTMLHKICASEAKLNDRHLIGRPLAEKYR